MGKSAKAVIFFVILALFLGGYIYLRHSEVFHQVLHGEKTQEKHASEDYIRYFGQIPDVEVARCDGFVMYFPAKNGGSFIPYPFFITSPEKRGLLIAEAMLSGLPLKVMASSVNPIFPGGGELDSIIVEGDTATLSVKLHGELTREELSIAARSFLMTYSQLNPGVNKVVLNGERSLGVEVDMGTTPSDLFPVKEPGPPVPLDAFIVLTGKGQPGEIRILFDRPVAVTSLLIEGPESKSIGGKLYLSEFSMAAVYRAEGPLDIEEGDTVSVTYKLHDYRGRISDGEHSFIARVEKVPDGQ